MALALTDLDLRTREAVRTFWRLREEADRKGKAKGTNDRGGRGAATAGSNMSGFAALLLDVVRHNGLPNAQVQNSMLELPGFFRRTKRWDVVVVHRDQLVAAVELKSHTGPSYSKNFNNRCEEALGSSHDFWTAHRETRFGAQARPFLGWMMLIQHEGKTTSSPRQESRPCFPPYPELRGLSYVERYGALCHRMVQERMYHSASVISTPEDAVHDGTYFDGAGVCSFRTFAASLAGHIAAEAARLD